MSLPDHVIDTTIDCSDMQLKDAWPESAPAPGTPAAQVTDALTLVRREPPYRRGGYYYRVRSLAPYRATCGEAAGRGRRWRAGERGSGITSSGWATCWATRTGAPRCGPTARACCCRASEGASSRWRPGSTRPGSAPRTSPCTTSSKAAWDDA